MAQFALHHVSVIVTDLPRSLAFYQKLFDFTTIERPPFKIGGAWLACGHLEMHLVVYPTGSFRIGNVDNHDCHFALRTDDFDGAVVKLNASGFREDAAEDDPMRILVRRNGPAGYPQLFLLDPEATSSRSTKRHTVTRESAGSVPRRESLLVIQGSARSESLR